MFLEIEGLAKAFGGLTAISDFGMSVDKGEIVGLIGDGALHRRKEER